MSGTRRVYCDILGAALHIPERPCRVVSFVSGLTEALCSMGLAHRIAGVSSYCHRYVPDLDAPVVGDYLSCDEDTLRSIQPDLVLTTSGVQRGLARRLNQAGFPVFVFPLPATLHGILENVTLLGGLLGEVEAATHLAERWLADLQKTSEAHSNGAIRVYPEIWFGPYPRIPGGLSFVNDIIRYAGGVNVYAASPSAYLPLAPEQVPALRPDVWLLFTEPEYPVDAAVLAEERGWNEQVPGLRVILASVTPEHNVIHDGPSMTRAVAWLADRLSECTGY